MKDRIKNKKFAFTLAEVLITLGIIGVVATLTIPSLISNYQKSQAVTQLQKFYTNMNQAIKLSEIENGPASEWEYGQVNSGDDTETWFNTYIAKYLKYNKVEKITVEILVYFADGTFVEFRKMGPYMHMIIHFSQNKNIPGKNIFTFLLPTVNSYANYSTNKVYKFGPYDYNITNINDRTSWKNDADYGCNNSAPEKAHCAGLIMYDSWKIADDYPW